MEKQQQIEESERNDVLRCELKSMQAQLHWAFSTHIHTEWEEPYTTGAAYRTARHLLNRFRLPRAHVIPNFDGFEYGRAVKVCREAFSLERPISDMDGVPIDALILIISEWDGWVFGQLRLAGEITRAESLEEYGDSQYFVLVDPLNMYADAKRSMNNGITEETLNGIMRVVPSVAGKNEKV